MKYKCALPFLVLALVATSFAALRAFVPETVPQIVSCCCDDSIPCAEHSSPSSSDEACPCAPAVCGGSTALTLASVPTLSVPTAAPTGDYPLEDSTAESRRTEPLLQPPKWSV